MSGTYSLYTAEDARFASSHVTQKDDSLNLQAGLYHDPHPSRPVQFRLSVT